MTIDAMAKIEEKTSDEDLIRWARTDKEALAELYRRYYERILRYCVHRLFRQEVAEDVTADVFLNVARRIRDFQVNSEKDFCRWIYTIANLLIITRLRKTSRRRKLLMAAAKAGRVDPQVCESQQEENNWAVLHGAISELKPQHQAIVVMRFFEKLPFEEIAAILGVKHVTVRVGLTRALRKLQKILPKGYLDGD